MHMDRVQPVAPRQPATRQMPARAIERMQAGTKPRNRTTQVLIAVFSIAVIGVAGFGLHLAVQKVNSQQIEKVRIEGVLTYVSEEEVKATIGADVSTSLMSVDLNRIKEKLEAMPWVRQAEVQRQWPNALQIRIEEEIAIARWGQRQLLNQQGQVFQPERIEESLQLPLLVGPKESEAKVMRQYQEFNQLLYPLGERIRDLTLNNSGSYELTLTNGVRVKLGREDLLERLRRLVMFLQSEFGRDLQGVESIDLRYRNGVAVANRKVISGSVPPAKTSSVVAR